MSSWCWADEGQPGLGNARDVGSGGGIRHRIPCASTTCRRDTVPTCPLGPLNAPPETCCTCMCHVTTLHLRTNESNTYTVNETFPGILEPRRKHSISHVCEVPTGMYVADRYVYIVMIPCARPCQTGTSFQRLCSARGYNTRPGLDHERPLFH